MLGEATLHVSRTFAGERNTASHSVCRPAKALPWGLWHPILMQFYSGPLMHLLSGVDTIGHHWVVTRNSLAVIIAAGTPGVRGECLPIDAHGTDGYLSEWWI